MNWFKKNVLLNFVLLQAINSVIGNPQDVANLVFRSNLGTKNPVISMGCFSDYILKSREISEAYSQDYGQCLLDAQADRQATDNEMQDKRLAIGESSQNICGRLSMCDGLNTTLEAFHCHALIGANNTRDVYSISGNASEYASVLQESYRQIDLRHEQCFRISERKYVESTGVNYRKLQSCLDGHIIPSSPVGIGRSSLTSLTKVAPFASDTEVESYPENFDTTSLEAAEIANTTL